MNRRLASLKQPKPIIAGTDDGSDSMETPITILPYQMSLVGSGNTQCVLKAETEQGICAMVTTPSNKKPQKFTDVVTEWGTLTVSVTPDADVFLFPPPRTCATTDTACVQILNDAFAYFVPKNHTVTLADWTINQELAKRTETDYLSTVYSLVPAKKDDGVTDAPSVLSPMLKFLRDTKCSYNDLFQAYTQSTDGIRLSLRPVNTNSDKPVMATVAIVVDKYTPPVYPKFQPSDLKGLSIGDEGEDDDEEEDGDEHEGDREDDDEDDGEDE